jgi:hypothetical protein
MRRQDPCIEIEITHPQLQAFKQPQTAAEQQVDYEVMGIRLLWEHMVIIYGHGQLTGHIVE